MSVCDGWDFAEIIFDFLANLPRTIRRDIVSATVRYACVVRSKGEVTDLAALGAQLTQDPGPSLFGAVLRIVSSVDYVLARSADRIGAARPMLEQLIREASPLEALVLERSLLQLPLRQRHSAQAAEAWSALRETFLSGANLQRLDDWCAREFERRTAPPPAARTGALQ